jgi:hypothetical protein
MIFQSGVKFIYPHPWREAMTLAQGQILNNRYRIVKLLGQGGYGFWRSRGRNFIIGVFAAG